MRLLAFLFLAVSLPAHAAKGNGGPSAASQMQAGGVHGGGGGTRYGDPRRAPLLDPNRKVNEQDCSKPVNIEAGNLKCK